MKGLTVQERRVLIAILMALVVGAMVRYWRRQGNTVSEDAGSEQVLMLKE